MSYRSDDDRQMLRDFIAWLTRVGVLKVEDTGMQRRYVDVYLKEKAEQQAWGKRD